MKKIFYTTLILLSSLLLFSCDNSMIDKKIETTQTKDTIVNVPKIVFILIGKNIDFNTMEIDSVIKILKIDSTLTVKPINKEIYLKPQIIKVYKSEDLKCNYLKEKFKEYEPGYLLYEYNDKMIIKAKNGVMKIYHYHLDLDKK